MNTQMIFAVLLALAVLAVVIALQIWWRRHRSHETLAQKKREDRQIETDNQVW